MENLEDSKQSNNKADCAKRFTCHQAVVQPNDCTKLPNLFLEVEGDMWSLKWWTNSVPCYAPYRSGRHITNRWSMLLLRSESSELLTMQAPT